MNSKTFIYLAITCGIVFADLFYFTQVKPNSVATFLGMFIGQLGATVVVSGVIVIFGSLINKRFIGYESWSIILLIITALAFCGNNFA